MVMNVGDAIRAAAERLSGASDTARFDAEILMAHALGEGRSDMLLRHMTGARPDAFLGLVDRRAAHEPVAYITGTQEFYGREFQVTRDVLIPRSDSEMVVEAALAQLPDPARVLDLGTGSGALLLTLLAETDAIGIGIDQSARAIKVAAKNAANLGLSDRATLQQGDWNEEDWAERLGRFDVVIANPPYVADAAELDPDVRDFEPAGALFAGVDGLSDYQTIIPQLRGLLSTNGIAVLEIGATQASAVTALAERESFKIKLFRDLAGRDRALVLKVGVIRG